MKLPYLLITALLLVFNLAVMAQHKIVWEIATGDTSVQRMLYRQVNNVLNAAPDTKIEIVFHGFAIYALLKDTGHYKKELLEVHKRGVMLAACNNSLKNRGIDPSRLMPEAFIVPVAILEIAKKQEEGWSYIRAGH